MKSKTSISSKIILTIFMLVIILPVLTLLVWTFTERWAWPDLWPQVFSMRAVDEILRRKEELIKLFASSILISLVVAVLSIVIGTMTARALVLYDFPGKDGAYFLSILPFMVPGTVFAMGVQVTFIKLGLNNNVLGVIIAHLVCSLPFDGWHDGGGKWIGRAGTCSGSDTMESILQSDASHAGSGHVVVF